MLPDGVRLPARELGELRERYGIRRLSVFGSALTDRFGADSDVDMLVEFRPGERVGFFRLMRLQSELSELVGRSVDLHTPGSLSEYFRDEVLRYAEVILDDVA